MRSAHAMLRRLLTQALGALDETEKSIILRLRLAAEPDTVEAVAADLGMSVQRLRQRETRALTRLRRDLLALGFTRAMLH